MADELPAHADPYRWPAVELVQVGEARALRCLICGETFDLGVHPSDPFFAFTLELAVAHLETVHGYTEGMTSNI